MFLCKIVIAFYMHGHAEEKTLAEVCHRAKINKQTNKQTVNTEMENI